MSYLMTHTPPAHTHTMVKTSRPLKLALAVETREAIYPLAATATGGLWAAGDNDLLDALGSSLQLPGREWEHQGEDGVGDVEWPRAGG